MPENLKVYKLNSLGKVEIFKRDKFKNSGTILFDDFYSWLHNLIYLIS